MSVLVGWLVVLAIFNALLEVRLLTGKRLGILGNAALP